jgi:hypothetical protein
MPKPRPTPDDPAQYKRFVEMATELGADATPQEFDKAFRKVASAKRTPRPEPKKRAKKRAR